MVSPALDHRLIAANPLGSNTEVILSQIMSYDSLRVGQQIDEGLNVQQIDLAIAVDIRFRLESAGCQ